MRFLFIVTAFIFSATNIFAQSLDDVRLRINQGDYNGAKTLVDNFLAQPGNFKNANAFYYKATIEFNLASADVNNTLSYDAGYESFNAYKKTLQLDPNNVLMTGEQNAGFFRLFDLFYNRGIEHYNNKSYDAAFALFKKTIDVQDYVKLNQLSFNGYTAPALDTQLLNLAGSSAYLAGKPELSIPYYETLANARLTDAAYKDIYAIIIQYYTGIRSDANASKYLSIAKQLYPDEDYWLRLEFGNIENNQAAKLRRYEEMLLKYPGHSALLLDYSIELFNYTYDWNKKPSDYLARQNNLQKAIDKALAANPANPVGYFVASQHYYTQALDLQEARRALRNDKSAAGRKKIVDLDKQINEKYDKMAVASQKIVDMFTINSNPGENDKSNYRKSLDQLIDYYTRKKMPEQVKYYQEKKAAIR